MIQITPLRCNFCELPVFDAIRVRYIIFHSFDPSHIHFDFSVVTFLALPADAECWRILVHLRVPKTQTIATTMTHAYLLLPAIAVIASTLIIRMQFRAARVRGDELSPGEFGQIAFALLLAAFATVFAFLVVKEHIPM